MSKGSRQRKSQISIEEEDLRWELCKITTTPERKEEILKLLKVLSDK